MGGVYLQSRLLKAAGLGTGLVKGKTLDVFVLLVTGRMLAERGLPPPLTLVQVGEELFPGEEDLGEGQIPVGEFVRALEELMYVGKHGKHVLVLDPLTDPKNYLREEKRDHPWIKKKPSFKAVLSSNLLHSPRLSPASGRPSNLVPRGDDLYTIEKTEKRINDKGTKRIEWSITPTIESSPSGEDLAKKMNLGLPKDSMERTRFVKGIACLAVFALRTVPFSEEAFRDPEALSEAIVSGFKKVYGLVAEKLLDQTEEEVRKAVEDLVFETYRESSLVSDELSQTPV